MSNTKIGVLGSGQVARVLADGFLKHGYAVMMGSRDPGKLADWKQKAGANGNTGTFSETAAFGDILVLAVKGSGAVEAIKQAVPGNLAGKTILDTTNPIADAPPVNGVIRFFTDLNTSLMEELQRTAPEANFVKAFSCIGNAFMVNPSFPEGKPSMFICGNNVSAKEEASEILKKFGFDIADMGAVEAARAIEPLCMLWCIPGIARGEWKHAFRLIRM